MITIDTLTTFLGWCTVINMGLLLLSTFLSIVLYKTVVRIHGKLFHLEAADISREFYHFLGQYKIAILMLNIVPYIALKVIA